MPRFDRGELYAVLCPGWCDGGAGLRQEFRFRGHCKREHPPKGRDHPPVRLWPGCAARGAARFRTLSSDRWTERLTFTPASMRPGGCSRVRSDAGAARGLHEDGIDFANHRPAEKTRHGRPPVGARGAAAASSVTRSTPAAPRLACAGVVALCRWARAHRGSLASLLGTDTSTPLTSLERALIGR